MEKLFVEEVPSKDRVNLSQWFQNVFEESWQTLEQLFEPSMTYAYALRNRGADSVDTKTVSDLIETIEATQDEETRWSAVESLWRLDPNNLAGGLRRVKDLGMLIGEHPMALMVAVLTKTDRTRGVLLRVYPLRNQQYLPPHLQLVVLDESGNTFLEAEAREQDNCIQLKFSGLPGEQFSVRVALREAKITENFIL